MPIYIYKDMRYVLKKLDFKLIRSSANKTWQKANLILVYDGSVI